MAKCLQPGRNMCAPSGKICALFVDIDGTIMECDPYFDTARERFGHLMAKEGFHKQSAIELLKHAYFKNMAANGVERDQLSKSMVEVYAALCKQTKRRKNKLIAGICEDIGNSPFFREPKLFPNAAPVLGRSRHNFLMIAVTMGNREAQKYKIRQGGLDSIFDHLIITPFDNKADRVRELVEDLNIDPEHSAFIGNSMKSDGQCLAVTNFIHLPFERGVFDTVDVPDGSGFDMFKVKDWRDAEERAILRLLRRRHTETDDEECGECSTPPAYVSKP